MTLAISEVFGPTFQGEAKFVGQRCAFLRLGACNLDCSWCDTPYTWDNTRFDLKKEIKTIEIDKILKKILGMQVGIVVISGGEPLLQQKKTGWADLLSKFKDELIDVHIETNGTITPNLVSLQRIAHFSVSPKLTSAKVSVEKKRFNDEAMEVFKRLAREGKALFKFVCHDENDLIEVLGIEQAYGLSKEDIWIMPEGVNKTTIQKRLESLADLVLDYGYHFTPRLHTLIWGAERAK